MTIALAIFYFFLGFITCGLVCEKRVKSAEQVRNNLRAFIERYWQKEEK